MRRGGFLRWAAAAVAASTLAACSSSVETIVSDDAAFCRYSAEAGVSTYDQCKNRLDGRRRQVTVASASRIEGYALLNTPLPTQTDITGSIKRNPSTPEPSMTEPPKEQAK